MPGKNIRPLMGKPLLLHTMDVARASGLFDCIAVSSDAEDILAVAEQGGADLLVRRPSELANDTSSKMPAITHCVKEAEARTGITFGCVVDLDVTSPLRLVEDLLGAVQLWQESGANSVITGAPARRSPYFNLVERREDGTVTLSKTPASPILRRQDAPACFDMNASIYVWKRDALMAEGKVFYPDTRLFEMPEDRSVDIDSPLDFLIVESLLRQREGMD